MKHLYNKINRHVLKDRIMTDPTPRTTISFYQYYHLGNPQLFRDHFYILLSEIGVLGRIYVSYEGVNGQISVPNYNLEALRKALNTITFLEDIRLNYAIEDDGKSFFKLIIKVRDKIVADGLDDSTFDVTNKGIHLKAEEFNKMTDDPETIIVDMRNHYESEVGHFKDAILPDVETFKEALPVVERMLEDKKDRNIIMYCTGGIRCEKASAYFKHKGFKHIYQVEGGIIEYARRAKELGIENKYIGKNFVFDERLGEQISDEVIAHCHQCGAPCDTHVNCANDACHILFIQCPECAAKYEHTCSEKCKEFNHLTEDKRIELRKTEIFNGTKFGKGRYKAHKKTQSLETFLNDPKV
ncbi:MAG: rhodanese-related sulfurtransferase [Saprospiraceae bacterium]|nr:MAG: sulfurtransferase [Bacteroidetes bacterium OLB9]MCO6463808.1 rhodanese-related sulfurtransferase [Saprospiraceae bacterium]MCZ2337128.1 rhodanese-related sulfurtransferase [Chitinophagales bacterium]